MPYNTQPVPEEDLLAILDKLCQKYSLEQSRAILAAMEPYIPRLLPKNLAPNPAVSKATFPIRQPNTNRSNVEGKESVTA